MNSENASVSRNGKSFGSRCSRFLYFIINLLTWLGGGALIGVAIWIVVSENEYKHFMENQTIFIAYITLATILFTAGILGTFGFLLGNRALLKVYFFIVCVVFCTLFGLLILGVVKRSRMDEIVVNQWNRTNDDTRIFLQTKFDCCDVGEYVSERPSNTDPSCFVNITNYERKLDCLTKLVQWFEDNQIIIASAAGAVMGSLITLMAGSCYFIRKFGSTQSERKRNRVGPQEENNNDLPDGCEMTPVEEEDSDISQRRKTETARKVRSLQRHAWAKHSSLHTSSSY
ncbi:tetraspanin-9-like [Xenia sp. Carnegie-2017]|uniref:tetraspanin-9-like n=1 Tax=Xenia sp. Carnegie-2017 TaxID=2897299 RepID=UPI001F0457DC|nr:tetraspanin-9-like [Xenia sp. Carnegie-2017]